MRANGMMMGVVGAAAGVVAMAGTAMGQEITAIDPIDGFETLFQIRLSGDGTTAAGTYQNADGTQRGFRWTSSEGLMVLDGSSPGQSVRAADLSSDGSIVVGFTGTGSQSRGVRWIGSVSPTTMAGAPSSQGNVAFSTNTDGSIVAGTFISPFEAFRWTEDGLYSRLGALPSSGSQSLDISADGAVVVGLSSPGGVPLSRPFRWTEADGITDIGTPPGDQFALARTISGDGSAIMGESWETDVGFLEGIRSPVRWTAAGGSVRMDMIPDTRFPFVQDATFDGSLMFGGVRLLDDTRVATIWTADGSIMLASDYLADAGVDLTGWTLTTVDGTSFGGTILAGRGVFEGESRFWVANLTGAFPTPPTITVQPTASQIVDAGSTIELSVVVDIGTSEPTFQWRRNGEALSAGAPYSGVDTPDLVISGATAGETDIYDVVVTNDAGSVTSDPALLAVRQPCAADFDSDGQLTLFDFLAFQNAFDAGCP